MTEATEKEEVAPLGGDELLSKKKSTYPVMDIHGRICSCFTRFLWVTSHNPSPRLCKVTSLSPNVGLVTFTTIEMVTFSHHPKKVTFAELPGREKSTKFNIFLGKFHCDQFPPGWSRQMVLIVREYLQNPP